MKINVSEEFVFIDVKATKNATYGVLILGAKDFSGTTSFLVNLDEVRIDFEERSLVKVDFSIILSSKKINNDYVDVVSSKRLHKIKKS